MMVALVSGGALLEHTTLDMLPQLMSLLMQKLPAVQQLTSRLMKSVPERKPAISTTASCSRYADQKDDPNKEEEAFCGGATQITQGEECVSYLQELGWEPPV
ncbi:GM23422 [Drosophila sechellia]|uniref:GM23422 n=1 Tax=Drosophila sechellia TaxID=7238 RepID=B4ILM8_DROSE|nr:GM23422 [Drosophila sechellia]